MRKAPVRCSAISTRALRETTTWRYVALLACCTTSLSIQRAEREGIGRMLLNATLAALLARGAPRVVLSTAERNEAAQCLFAFAGFRRTMVEMTRELRQPKPSPG